MTGARRLLALLVIAAVTIVGLATLANATKYEGEAGTPGYRTVVEFTVKTRNYHHDREDAAEALWSVCAGIISWEQTDPPRATAEGSYIASVFPALGEDARRRLRGCLNEATVDRILGSVTAMWEEPAPLTP